MARKKSDLKGPTIVYRRGFLNSPGAPEELKEILMWWEMALVRKAQAKLANEREHKP